MIPCWLWNLLGSRSRAERNTWNFVIPQVRNDSVFNKLQSILCASARLVLLLPGRASVSSLMHVRLHWLPFPERIKFKLCSTVYKWLHDVAPAYLSEFCVPLSSQADRSQLRSAAAGDLLIPSTRTVTIGGWGFSVAGPAAWNSLPMDLKDGTLTFPVFKKLLKTHLFDTIWTAAPSLCGDCMKGALQVPVSIQFISGPFKLMPGSLARGCVRSIT